MASSSYPPPNFHIHAAGNIASSPNSANIASNIASNITYTYPGECPFTYADQTRCGLGVKPDGWCGGHGGVECVSCHRQAVGQCSAEGVALEYCGFPLCANCIHVLGPTGIQHSKSSKVDRKAIADDLQKLLTELNDE